MSAGVDFDLVNAMKHTWRKIECVNLIPNEDGGVVCGGGQELDSLFRG
jgi:hypothetical protein